MSQSSSNITQLPESSDQHLIPEGSYTGQIIELDSKGCVRKVLTDQGQLLHVSHQSISVGRAAIHDQCIVLKILNKMIVTDLLLNDEAPFGIEVKNGQLVINASEHFGGIKIETGNSSIELTEEGRITLNGKQMSSRMEETLSLESRRISLDDID